MSQYPTTEESKDLTNMKNQNTWNRKAFLCSAITAITLLASNLPITQAQSVKQSSKCAVTLQSVKNKIKQGRRITIVRVSKDNISEEYQSYPKNRPHSYYFLLQGAAANSVLESSQFLTALSKNIITSCSDVSQITYALDASDYWRTFGLMSGNKVNEFKYIKASPTDNNLPKLPWGSDYYYL